MALQWHPDKNKDPTAHERFRLIATAYETLSDGDIRSAYDYSLEHPEQQIYNQYRYYKAAYQPQVPLWAVVLGLLVFLSVLQYVNRWTLHGSMVANVQRTATFRLRLAEREAAMAKERGVRLALLSERDRGRCLQDTVQTVEIGGLSPPRLLDVALFQAVLLPLRAAGWALHSLWHCREIRQRRAAIRASAAAKRQHEEEEATTAAAAVELQEQQRSAGKQRAAEGREADRAARERRARDRAEQERLEVEREAEAVRRKVTAKQSFETQLGRFLAGCRRPCAVKQADHGLLAQYLELSELEELLRRFGFGPDAEPETVRLLEDGKRRGDAEVHKRQKEEERRRREAAAKAEEAASKTAKEWTAEELSRLAKAMVKFPGGTSKRWETVARFVETRDEKQCAQKAKELASGPAQSVFEGFKPPPKRP